MKDTQCSLYLDREEGSAEYSHAMIESSKQNDWGIPDSKTLDPLAKSPLSQLDNGAKITLVGSGPGDPDLLTVKALKLLQDPNALVICDRLVSQEIVELVRGEIKTARKLPGCADLAQEEIYWWTYQGLKAGKHVIRLKIGDPFVFGRGGEEILTFRRFGVESTVIPVSGLTPFEIFFWLESHIIDCIIQKGSIGSILGTSPWKYSRHPPRSCEPGRHVHWVRSRRDFSRSHSIPQRTDCCFPHGCGALARTMW